MIDEKSPNKEGFYSQNNAQRDSTCHNVAFVDVRRWMFFLTRLPRGLVGMALFSRTIREGRTHVCSDVPCPDCARVLFCPSVSYTAKETNDFSSLWLSHGLAIPWLLSYLCKLFKNVALVNNPCSTYVFLPHVEQPFWEPGNRPKFLGALATLSTK